jgi:hypothetical protein
MLRLPFKDECGYRQEKPEHRFCSVTGVEWESESRASVGLSSTDAEGWHARNRERNQCGRIMDTHRRIVPSRRVNTFSRDLVSPRSD